MQFKLCLKVNNEVIRPVKIDDLFKYLGKSLSSSVSWEGIKTELIEQNTLKKSTDFHYI